MWKSRRRRSCYGRKSGFWYNFHISVFYENGEPVKGAVNSQPDEIAFREFATGKDSVPSLHCTYSDMQTLEHEVYDWDSDGYPSVNLPKFNALFDKPLPHTTVLLDLPDYTDTD